MIIENGKIVTLAIVNHLDGKIWCTYEMEAQYPQGFVDEDVISFLSGMSVKDNGSHSQPYPGPLPFSNNLIIKLPLYLFKGANRVENGMIFTSKVQMKIFSGKVIDHDELNVTLDCNYPLADQSFASTSFIVVDVRAAKEDEIHQGFETTLRLI